jgi:PilZ domain
MSELGGNLKGEHADLSERGQNRNSLLVKASLRFPVSGETAEVRVRNLSPGGMMAEGPIQVVRGKMVEVHLKNIGWVSGKVAWIAESRFGISFDYEINPKATQQPTKASGNDEMPNYLRKLNEQTRPPEPGKLRRL